MHASNVCVACGRYKCGHLNLNTDMSSLHAAFCTCATCTRAPLKAAHISKGYIFYINETISG